jgi:hypothetical protein
LIRTELKFVLGWGPAYAVDRINTGTRFGAGVNAAPQKEARLKFDGSRHLKPDRRSLHLLHRRSLLPSGRLARATSALIRLSKGSHMSDHELLESRLQDKETNLVEIAAKITEVLADLILWLLLMINRS